MKQLDIEPIKKCLHNQKCKYLVSRAGERPMCKYEGEAIFDLDECPFGWWWMAVNQECLSLIRVNKEVNNGS